MNFTELELAPPLLEAVRRLGYVRPSPIQSRAIPVVLSGRDVIACAETGSGKTAAYLLPTLQRLAGGVGLRALVVAPTRELALQIEEVAHGLGEGLGLRSGSVIGGASMSRQISALRCGVDLLVATPGRLLDHMRQKTVRLDRISVVVVDEADRLLDMGFLPDVRSILAATPRNRQTLLFAATLSPAIEAMGREMLRDPELVEVGVRARTVASLEQAVYSVWRHEKPSLLLALLRQKVGGRTLVFTRTRRGAEQVGRILRNEGLHADLLHAGRSQSQRTSALQRFRHGKVPVLVATDVASRGLDVEGIDYVINYDIPGTPEAYVHRVGRTARVGQKGLAMTLVLPEEEGDFRRIESFTAQSVRRDTVDGFQAAFDPAVLSRPASRRPGVRVFRPRRGRFSRFGR